MSLDAMREIAARKSISAHEFAMAVLIAEGFEHPEYELDLQRMLRKTFFDWFGRATVSTGDYGTPGTKEHLRIKPPRPR
jgi:hypothetical protein